MTVGPVRRDDATAAFFDGTTRRELLIKRCQAGHHSEPSAESCTTCGSIEFAWVPAAGGARVASWAVVHARGTVDRSADRTVLVIAELDEGPWLWSQIVDADPDAPAEGQRLQVDFARADDGHEAIPVFRMA
jgi:uncharacterized protein